MSLPHPDDAGKTKVIIAKHRNGEIADIDMLFRASEVRFVDMSDTLLSQAESGTFSSGMNDDVPFGPPQAFPGDSPEFGGNTDFM